MDNAETTRVDPLVAEVVKEYMLERYGLPGGEFGYGLSEEASRALESARRIIAMKINAKPDEIVFTSGGTESNNLAIKGTFPRLKTDSKAIITSKIEQRTILNIVHHLESAGASVTYLDVNEEGFVDIAQLQERLPGAGLVSIQHSNQEIGTIQDLKTIGELCDKHNIILHSDATQSFTKERIDVEKMKIDLLSVNSHLIHGPKGIGALYIREGVKIDPLFQGDDREFGLRPGTPNLPGVMGFAKAVELVGDDEPARMSKLREKLFDQLLLIGDTKLNGPRGEKRLCSNVNVTFRQVEGEALLLSADMEGLVVNTGSACYNRKLQSSHVIRAIGGTYEESHGSTRLTLGRWTTSEEVDLAAQILRRVVDKLRSFSPLRRRES